MTFCCVAIEVVKPALDEAMYRLVVKSTIKTAMNMAEAIRKCVFLTERLGSAASAARGQPTGPL
jgi:hypothetical protein